MFFLLKKIPQIPNKNKSVEQVKKLRQFIKETTFLVG
jgi:hypothetical protein